MGKPDNPVLIELDGRRRAALGRLARHDRYLARQEPDGTLILTPAEVMTIHEAAVLRAPAELIEDLEEKMRHPERLIRPANDL